NVLTIKRHANTLSFAVPTLGYYLVGDVTASSLVPDSSRDQVTDYTYDLAGRLTSETRDSGGLGLVTQYKYDAHGRLTRKVDARGNSTWYVYDNA
ncbi:RHS repeat domain-containing protein, partial [Acinetobacter baumannii]